MYLVPFLRYSASKNGSILKQGLGVVEVTSNPDFKVTII